MNNYSILGIPNGSPTQLVKKAYKKLAFKYHPDRNGGSDQAKSKFIEIKNAYDNIVKGKNNSAQTEAKPKYNTNTNTAPPYVNIHNAYMTDKGDFKIEATYSQVGHIRVEGGGRYNIPRSFFKGNFVVKEETLRKIKYKVDIHFYSIEGGILTKSWDLPTPKLSLKQKLRKFINLRY